MAKLDLMIIVCALGAFAVFVAAHIVTSRRLADEKIFGIIQIVFLFGAGALTAAVWLWPGLNTADRLMAFVSALGVYGLASFFYVLCLFGPYATSIRLRLIKELDVPAGKTLAVVKDSYNDQVILDTRLKRLLSAGDISCAAGVYKMVRSKNVFFVIDALARKLHALIRPG